MPYGSFWGRLSFARETWSAQVQGVKSAPAATCKQQSVRSVHVKVCPIVQAGTSRATLGTFRSSAKYRQSEPSLSQPGPWIQGPEPGVRTCPWTRVHSVQVNRADMTMHGMIDIN